MLSALAIVLALAAGADKDAASQTFIEKMSPADRAAFVADMEATVAKFKADCLRVIPHAGYCECLALESPVAWRTFEMYVHHMLDRAGGGPDAQIAASGRDACAKRFGLREPGR